MPRDNQKQAVYNWERSLGYGGAWPNSLGSARLSYAQMEQLVDEVCTELGTTQQPQIWIAKRSETWSWYHDFAPFNAGELGLSPYRPTIKLAPPMCNRQTVLHELSHFVRSRRFGSPRTWAEQGHGPEFAAVCAHLFAEFGGADEELARQIGGKQKPRRVQFADAQPQFAHLPYTRLLG